MTVFIVAVWGAIPFAMAMPGFYVETDGRGEAAEIIFSQVYLGSEKTVFDTLIHPTQFSNLQLSLGTDSEVRVIQETTGTGIISGDTQDIMTFQSRFPTSANDTFSNQNLNHYLGFDTFTFDDAFSYELQFAAPLLDDSPTTAEDDFTELFFTARDDNSYMLIEALESPGGATLGNSFLVDTNGWLPAQDIDGGGAVPQFGGTALYFRGLDLSMLGVSQAQYFRLSSVSTTTLGVTNLEANSAASGLSITAIQTVVPEPSSSALALLGAIALAARRRR